MHENSLNSSVFRISSSKAIRYDPRIGVGKLVGNAMGRQINKLSARKVETLKSAGRHSDGGGLYLNVTDSGARSWLFMYKQSGRRREMGLGSARDVPLNQARKLAGEARQQLASGLDPLAVRAKTASMTFAQTAAALIESMSPSWRNAKHRAQWAMTLNVYCTSIGGLAAADVTTDHVLQPCCLAAHAPRRATPRPLRYSSRRLIRAASFDHLVGAGEERRGHGECQRLRGL
jgi:hypothetical protein